MDAVTGNAASRRDDDNKRNADTVTDNNCHAVGQVDNRNGVTDNNLIRARLIAMRNNPIDEWICRRVLAFVAKKTAWHCGECGTAIPAGDPVWRRLVCVGKWGVRRLSVVCRKCSHAKTDPLEHCQNCGRGVGGRFNSTRQYISCSDACDSQIHAAIQRDKRAAIRGTRNCQSCGDTFTPKRSDSKYCSSKCRQKAYRQRGAA